MAGKKGTAGGDKFKIGQQVVLVLGPTSGWERVNGELGVVVGPQRMHTGHCSRCEDRGKGVGEPETSLRYAVRWKEGVNHFCEEHLRAIYDGEKLSTWEKFAKKTGIDVTATTSACQRVRSPDR